jgi:pyruvate/2-oxoglutarate/acetoin dehydrogenase E1 component
MTWLGHQPDTIFLGQNVRYPGNGLYSTLTGVPMDKRVELGVAEDMQLGIAIGLALSGKVPICIFPRMDFLLCATNQLVNHLEVMQKKHRPLKVIIRACVGSKTPLDPGPQHSGDYVKALKELLCKVLVIDLIRPDMIVPTYKSLYGPTLDREKEKQGSYWQSAVIIERGDLYGME